MGAAAEQMSESELRALAKQIYDRIGKAFDEVDPDEAECEESLGSLSIELPDGAKWILSVQPPVRQMWLAVASIGRAFHFDYDAASGTWQDDKGQGIELLSYLEGLLKEVAGLEVHF
ncbi:MAG: iron donor protein CyaY [SAR324 cluster bacterium]|nr:iron donor protein CyaY [SAR324 cluster bacterium]MCZ6558537.1 iron donor protein CyaY [SAR324 cluster bacterium]